MSLADLQADRKTIDAIERCLQRITEAVIQIDADELTKIIPDLPTSRIRGMGNMLRHEYRRVDPKIVFDTVRNDLPSLRAACVAALESGGR